MKKTVLFVVLVCAVFVFMVSCREKKTLKTR